MVDSRDCHNNGLEVGDFVKVNTFDAKNERLPNADREGIVMYIHNGYAFLVSNELKNDNIPATNKVAIFLSRTRYLVKSIVCPKVPTKRRPRKSRWNIPDAPTEMPNSPTQACLTVEASETVNAHPIEIRIDPTTNDSPLDQERTNFLEIDAISSASASPTTLIEGSPSDQEEEMSSHETWGGDQLDEAWNTSVWTSSNNQDAHQLTREFEEIQDYLISGKWCLVNLLVKVTSKHPNDSLVGREGAIRRVMGESAVVYFHRLDESFSISFKYFRPVKPKLRDRVFIIYGKNRDKCGILHSFDKENCVLRARDGSIIYVPYSYICKTI
uniref:Spt5 KOW domain-containing protein n=1 Tax=Acrobeloides nanus TaxID=290746 RepID=A0A914E6S5_9BILA